MVLRATTTTKKKKKSDGGRGGVASEARGASCINYAYDVFFLTTTRTTTLMRLSSALLLNAVRCTAARGRGGVGERAIAVQW